MLMFMLMLCRARFRSAKSAVTLMLIVYAYAYVTSKNQELSGFNMKFAYGSEQYKSENNLYYNHDFLNLLIINC